MQHLTLLVPPFYFLFGKKKTKKLNKKNCEKDNLKKKSQTHEKENFKAECL